MPYKLLVNNYVNDQEVVYIEKSGGYYDETRILWDERVSGALPAIVGPNLGGIVRNPDGSLAVDSVKLAAANAKKAQAVQDQINKDKAKVDRQTRRQSVDQAGLPELRQIVKDLLTELGFIT